MKKNEELLHITGDIDDDLIEKARPEKIRKKKTIKISVLSSAAVIALVLGMQYKFVFKPLSDAGGDNSVNNPVTVTSEVSETDIILPETISDAAEKSDLFPYKGIINRITNRVNTSNMKLMPSDKNSFLCAVNGVTDVIYVTFEESGNKYSMEAFNNIQNARKNFTVTENYLYAHMNKGLFCFDRSEGYLINEEYNFYSEFDLNHQAWLLGADNDENVYMLKYGEEEGPGTYTLLKYSPKLELLSSQETAKNDEEISNSDINYTGEHVFTLARGFDSINLSDGKMNIVYSGDCVLEYNFKTREYSSECEIAFEEKTTDAEAGIYKGGKYLCAKNRNGEIVLKCFFNIDENGSDFKREYSEDGREIYTYINGEVLYGCETKERAYSELQEYNTDGTMIDSQVIEDTDELITDEEIKAEELCTGESGTFNNPGFPESGFPYYISSLKFTDNGDMLCTLKIGASRAQISLSREPEPEEKCHIGVISPSGEYREITEKTIREHMKSGTVSPSPQNDGTFVYIYDSVLYSYDVQKNETTALCSISNYYNMLSGDILKLDDTTYVLPSSVYDSNLGNFYILKLEEK